MRLSSSAPAITVGFLLLASTPAASAQQREERPFPASITETLSLRNVLADLNEHLETDTPADEANAQTERAMAETIEHMGNGIVVISGWERSLVLYQSLSISTNLWRKKDIRSLYDRIEGWGTALGSVVAATAFLSDDDEERDDTAAAGLGLIGVSQLVGQLFGKSTSARYAENLLFIDMTVRAYDDLKQHRERLIRAADDNENVLKVKLDDVSRKFSQAQDTKKRLELLPDVLGLIDEYQLAIGELLTINDEVQALASRALLELEDKDALPPAAESDDLKSIRDELRQVAEGARQWEQKYEAKVHDFFSVSSEARASLTAAQTKVTTSR